MWPCLVQLRGIAEALATFTSESGSGWQQVGLYDSDRHDCE